MIEIALTQGKVAIVDNIDGDLNSFKWCYNARYAVRGIGTRPNQVAILMHRVILERILGRSLVKGEFVDHINMDGLDNRRANLRLATKAENMRNRGATANNTAGLKGVYWRKDKKKWQAQITFNYKNTYLGLFDTAELAHEAYCKAASELHGDFARFE